MKPISLAAAMRDPQLLGGPFQAESFWPWHCVAKLLSGEKLTLDRRELALFRKCTGRTKPPRKPVRRLYLQVGRRGGKDRFDSAVAVHRAALAADWSAVLSTGEQAVCILIGSDKKQAGILARYSSGLLKAPLLAAEVAREAGDVIEFKNGAALEIVTNDARLVRGRSAIAVIATEVSFWATDPDSASSDEEVAGAAEPSMAMIPDGGLMVLSSSPYRKRGLMYRRSRELFGNDDAEDVYWVAPSWTMNPALPRSVVAKAMDDDPARARSEYGAEWREDLSDFIPLDVVELATDFGTRERAPIAGAARPAYFAFTDAAGGTGQDSFTVAVAHRETNGSAVLDCLRERKPRFTPAAVVEEYAALLKTYGISEVHGDKYAAGWNSDEWQRNGITYKPSGRTTSEVYLAALPLLLAGRARLVDMAALRSQLTGLERRTLGNGRESVSHAPQAHDDLCTSAMGAIVLAAAHEGYDTTMSWVTGGVTVEESNDAFRRSLRNAHILQR